MIVNSDTLLAHAPIKGMLSEKVKQHGVSHGLSEAGYDIRIKQFTKFYRPHKTMDMFHGQESWENGECVGRFSRQGRFLIASAIEEFDMPDNLVGIVHDKSTWARRGLSVFNTVIEPGWKGFLTLELVYHGSEELYIPAGAGIAQVVFHSTTNRTAYTGKYQNQADGPVAAKSERDSNTSAVSDVNGGRCPECGEQQRLCPSGVVCKNGHGY